jgi:hypothetical protein
LDRHPARTLRAGRAAWLASLVLLVAIGLMLAAEYQTVWTLPLRQVDQRSLKRQAAIAFLDGFLFAYLLALLAAIGATTVLACRRRRGPLSPRGARLLLLGVSVLVGVVSLETSAVAWHAWLHRHPRLPATLPEVAENDASGEFAHLTMPVAEPTLPSDLPARPGDASRRPLKFLVIGESSGRGEPYQPWLSVGQIVAWRLNQVFPGRLIEVDIWATGGATLEMMHLRLAGLTYRPDALIVYVGHNEFQARYAWMRDIDYYLDVDVIPRGASYPSLAFLARLSPLCRLIAATREGQQIDLIPPRTVTRELVDRPVCTSGESAAILADFGHRLDAIAGYCESIGTLPIFVVPPSNDAGFDPSRSVLAPETRKDERRAFARSVARARALETKDKIGAIRSERELVRSHPEFAETHFRLARLLEQIGSWGEAADHYALARERDAMPLRCPEPFREAYRDVGARHPGLILIDGPKVFAAKSLHGIVGDRFFHDAQHPNLLGYAALAQEVLDHLGARRAFGWPPSAPVPVVDLETCSRHFQLSASRWEKICSRGHSFFRATAYIRYDPRYRNERSAAYERAAAAIRAGVSPADASIPGWALPPKPTISHVIPPDADR